MRMQQVVIVLGALCLVGWAVLINPWLIAWLFTSDGRIESTAVYAGLVAVECVLVAAAALSVRSRAGAWQKPLFLVHALVLVATPGLVWAYWRVNPNAHHWHRPLTPQEALSRMTVPPGFTVELVASEPDIVNPVAMAFDHRGRIWVLESVEYPRLQRRESGGFDRIKILEDADGDGRIDKVKLFAEGLQLPTGLAVGQRGAWVLEAPDLLFLEDVDGDDRADRRQTIVTGFGRHDAHELPSSLTWGPDGWLYGLNGIANPGRIEHQGRLHEFSAAMFRVHPRSHRFEIFARGTSNPWGIAFGHQGSAFVAACVIDHLWHFSESGQYVTQNGRYPEGSWPIPSIVDHAHQAAAYAGLELFDSPAYPPQYRDRLYMGNIHGGCINVDRLERHGATWRATPEQDFLTAHDGWFMPLAVRTGPDGCLYVLDWYDRYHCYQDALRDRDGVDRRKGRLYRIRHESSPAVEKVDLAQESNDQLVARLQSPNAFFRRMSQRLLGRRLAESEQPELRQQLERQSLDPQRDLKFRMHALWSLLQSGHLPADFVLQLLDDRHPDVRAWGVRAMGNLGIASPALLERFQALARQPEPVVQLQVAIACGKLTAVDPLPIHVDVLTHSPQDPVLQRIVWAQILPHLEQDGGRLIELMNEQEAVDAPNLKPVQQRAVSRLLKMRTSADASVQWLASKLQSEEEIDAEAVASGLQTVIAQVQAAAVPEEQVERWRGWLSPGLQATFAGGPDRPLWRESVLLLTCWNDTVAMRAARDLLQQPRQETEFRLQAIDALVASAAPDVVDWLGPLLRPDHPHSDDRVRAHLLDVLARLDDQRVGRLVLEAFPSLASPLQSRAIGLLVSRSAWAHRLLDAVEQKRIAREMFSVDHLRRLQSLPDRSVREQAIARFGRVRETRDPARQQVIAEVRRLLRDRDGDPQRGKRVFAKVCSQCHRLHGEGHLLGPDLTANGRGSLEQLLSNVFDPNLVVGPAYRTTQILTVDGRVLSGLVVESGSAQIVLKMPGGRSETIARDSIEELAESSLSIMPEGFEKQLSEQQVVDLVAYLMADRPEAASQHRQALR